MAIRKVIPFVAAAALVVAACSSDGDPQAVDTASVADAPVATPAPTIEEPVQRELPTPVEAEEPVEFEEPVVPADLTYPAGDQDSLAELLNPVVAEFSVEFTRGALVERSPGVYETSDEGNHLALYVEPLENISDEQFVINMWDIAAVVTPWVFENFSGVTSYDICQEPYSAEPPQGIPPPVTQLDIDRTRSDAIDWENGDLSTLISALQNDDGGEMTLRVMPELQQTPAFVAALAALD